VGIGETQIEVGPELGRIKAQGSLVVLDTRFESAELNFNRAKSIEGGD
jgi:hypothetical protein